MSSEFRSFVPSRLGWVGTLCHHVAGGRKRCERSIGAGWGPGRQPAFRLLCSIYFFRVARAPNRWQWRYRVSCHNQSKSTSSALSPPATTRPQPTWRSFSSLPPAKRKQRVPQRPSVEGTFHPALRKPLTSGSGVTNASTKSMPVLRHRFGPAKPMVQ